MLELNLSKHLLHIWQYRNYRDYNQSTLCHTKHMCAVMSIDLWQYAEKGNQQ